MSQKLFRQAALDKLATPEELDKMIQVTNLRGWIALGGLGLIVVAALAWAIFGSLPTVVKAGGVLIRQDGIQEIQLPNGGVITNLALQPGDLVKEGQVIAQVKDANGVSQPLTSPFAGTVLEVLVSNNTPLKPQSTIVRIEQDSKPLKSILLLSLADGKQIKPGTKVQLSPSTVQSDEYGQLLGTVSFVSQLPVSPDTLLNQLKSPGLVTALSGDAPAIEVEVTLDPDPSTPSGFKWTTRDGPPFKLTNGTLCAANLVVGQQRPLDLVLPIFKGGS